MRSLVLLTLLAPLAFANGIVVEQNAPTARNAPAVRLTGHRVTATVKDRVARVIVEQTFHNESKLQVEGMYLFPLPRGAAVGEFEMRVGDQLIKGEVLDAGRARAIYRSIVQTRRDPGLLEYVGRGLFRARVFPIGPGKDVTVRLAYRQVLPEHSGTIEMRYPLSADALNRTAVKTILVDVHFESTVDLKSVYCPSHNVSVTRPDARNARVVYEASRVREARDLVMYFGRSAKDVGFSLLSTKPAGRDGTFLAVLAPSLALRPDEVVAKDVLYVIDTSGSMEGRKMEQAKRALKRGIAMLRDKDRFNVIGFSGEIKPMHAGLVAANDASRQEAAQWVDRLVAEGGTALSQAVLGAMRQASPARLTMVVLITDGLPTVGERDGDKIVAAAKRISLRPRVFTFGVGHDLDVKLLDRLAEMNGGAREYVAPHETIDAVVGRFFRLVDRPVLTDLVLEVDGVSQVYPKRLPDLFAGGQIIVMGRYRESGSKTLRLRGKRGGKDVTYVYEPQFAAKDADAYLERLWAGRKVAYLLDTMRLHGEEQELVDEVKRLGKRYTIVTPWTAGLVVEPGLRRRVTASSSPLYFSGMRRNVGAPPGMREPGDPEPPPPPPSDPGTPQGPTSPNTPPTSRAIRKAKTATRRPGESFIKVAADKTFFWSWKQRWVDNRWDGKLKPNVIEAYSDAYFELLDKDDRIARYLALGERILFVFDGTAYEIVPTDD